MAAFFNSELLNLKTSASNDSAEVFLGFEACQFLSQGASEQVMGRLFRGSFK